MIDIDHFKRFNDRYGHQAGDNCLQSVAVTLKDRLRRANDLVSLYGGEEFVCILPDCDPAGTIAKAEELRAAVAALGIAHDNSPTSPMITISVGIAVCVPDATRTVEQLLADADAALYRAKDQGRNRVAT